MRERGGEFGVRTPVESREQREAGITNDVVVPVLLGLAAGVAAMLVWLSLLLAVRSLGREIATVAALLWSTALLCWTLLRGWRGAEWTAGTLMTGILVGAVGAVAAWAMFRLSLVVPIRAALGVTPLIGALVAMIWIWLSTLQESALRSPFVEQALANIIGGEGGPWWQDRIDQEEPEPVEPPARIEVSVPGEARMWYSDAPLSLAALGQVARIVLAGGSLSEPHLVGGDRPLSRAEFERLRDWGMEDGRSLWRWRDEDAHRQGIEVTPAGVAFLEAIAGEVG
jgi:hypothetical protein